ncbi:gamma-crystallin N [Pectobacterium phage POP12]|nr:gamma-crystallin N [Pectobacterium phage POP12]
MKNESKVYVLNYHEQDLSAEFLGLLLASGQELLKVSPITIYDNHFIGYSMTLVYNDSDSEKVEKFLKRINATKIDTKLWETLS